MALTDRLDQIQARADAATPGPWQDYGDTIAAPDDKAQCGVCPHGYYGAHEPTCGISPIAKAPESDAPFIAAAREDVPALVAALRAVLATHRKATLYPADENGIVDLDAAPLMDYCEECTPTDTTESIDDACWQDGMETVRYPCDTVQAIESALGGAL